LFATVKLIYFIEAVAGCVKIRIGSYELTGTDIPGVPEVLLKQKLTKSRYLVSL
jgi:hypothetical protein